MQVVLNLVKNAAEAVTQDGNRNREIMLTTGFQHGMRLAVPGSTERLRSAAGGRACATTGRAFRRTSGRICSSRSSRSKSAGSGLGLALVAKIIGDHGGLIEVDSRPGRTEFRLHLPVLTDNGSPE